jgi:hypothetical protein
MNMLRTLATSHSQRDSSFGFYKSELKLLQNSAVRLAPLTSNVVEAYSSSPPPSKVERRCEDQLVLTNSFLNYFLLIYWALVGVCLLLSFAEWS